KKKKTPPSPRKRGKSEREPGSMTTGAYLFGARWSTSQCNGKYWWLWVPAPRAQLRARRGRWAERSASIISHIVAVELFRQFDHHPPGLQIYRRHHGVSERQQHGGALRRRNLDDIAGAEIVNPGPPARGPGGPVS